MQPSPEIIAPFKSGLVRDMTGLLAPPDSFQDCENFHIRHGYLQKRQGYRRFAYMVHNPTATITGVTAPGVSPVVVTAANTFSNGQQVLITNVQGMTELNGNIYTVANVTGADFELSGVDSTGYSAYSAGGRAALFTGDRIMGIERYINSDGSKTTLVFDDKRAAYFDTTNDVLVPLDAADIMDGSDEDYIWACNWQSPQNTGGRNLLFFTNGKAYDGVSKNGIRYYDPGTSTTTTTFFNPTVTTATTLYGCRLIFAIKQRLVLLYTFEGASTFRQRARWCQAANTSKWDDTIPGEGGYNDAPTGDQIISAGQIGDILIVQFTNSVWRLSPTSDPALPFRWDKINDYRACGGKMASQEYDSYLLGIGDRGITASDVRNTQRIDPHIQDFVNDDIFAEGFGKVFAMRDFANQRLWILYPETEDVNSGSIENKNALIMDEDTKSFTTYKISMNCLGYGNIGEDYAFDDFIAENDLDLSFEDFNDETFQSYYWPVSQEIFLGGSIDGIVYVLNTETTDDGDEIEASFFTNSWNPYQGEGVEAQLNYIDFLVDTDKNSLMQVEFYKDGSFDAYEVKQTDLLPPLKYISSVINITKSNPASVNAPSHGLSTGDVIYIYGVRGMTEIDGGYTITVTNGNNFTLDGVNSTSFSDYDGSGQVFSNAYYRTKAWKRVLAGGIGFQHRIKVSSGGSRSPVRIDQMKPYFKKRGTRSIN